MDSLAKHYLEDATTQFRKLKSLGDKALAQVDATSFFQVLAPEENSIAIVVKHLAGNMRSRWRDFLTSDGEKPDRHRDQEFEQKQEDTQASLFAEWEAGWDLFLKTLEELTPEDLLKTVAIRGEPHSVVQALNRQLTHYGYHIGQIVFLARHFQGEQWKSLSIPKGQSEVFNQKMQQHRT